MPRPLKPASQTNILLVDDTPDNLRLLSKILEVQGYIVRKSLNGKMALQAAVREPPDLILLDINMPEMNGYELCQQLKLEKITKNIPIIFISAIDDIKDKIKAFEIGGQDYITKPFQELEVIARIRNQLLIQEQQYQLEQEIQERLHAEKQIKLLNQDLEKRVQLRTQQLQQSLDFEATLKRITDKVRDTLNQHQILQSAVQELALALQLKCCDAAIYTNYHESSVIRYQYAALEENPNQGQLSHTADAPEIYHQLQQQKSYLAFCQIEPLPIRNESAILACPIFDEQVEEIGILGDLWLFKPTEETFSQMEINLVQQVANQCAIALRQARLYEASQAQVQELHRLNQLKDDFLNTITHELRSPIANMKMMIQLLTAFFQQGEGLIQGLPQSLLHEHQIVEYLNLLNKDCEYELKLIEDILLLQHLEAGTYPQQLIKINLQDLIGHIIEPLAIKIKNQQQTFSVNILADLPTIEIDSFSLGRIITELINNAYKYTPPGENISLSATVVDDNTVLSDNVFLLSRRYISFIELIVTNTGITIPPEEHSRIFDKFYRINGSHPGKNGSTGLGLALVKKLVENLNGHIFVESLNNITQFTVRFPLIN
ncbi:sensor histidine kinase [Nostoc sp. NIES-2111]|nr:sensor histidine kinase [Nostoc sp. NIES-2111]